MNMTCMRMRYNLETDEELRGKQKIISSQLKVLNFSLFNEITLSYSH